MRRFASLGAWIAFVALPLRAGGWVAGVPLGPLEATALLAIGWLWWRRPGLPGARTVSAALAIKVLLTIAAPFPGGFRARYFANAEARPPVERSVEFREEGFTRIDRRLDFAQSARELPLAFFNDIERFNFYEATQPDRTKLAFAAAWEGYWWIDAGRPLRRLYLDAPGASAQLTIDGFPALATSPSEPLKTVDLPLRPGWRRVELRLSSPYGAPRRVSAGNVVNGTRAPFDEATIVARRIPDWRVPFVRARRWIATAIDTALLAWLAALFAAAVVRELRAFGGDADRASRQRRALAVCALLIAADALVFATPWAGRLMLLGGGGDPMTYEFDARDILLNGPLMTVHAPLGQGEPFYYQPLYAYFLAGCHGLFGEGMFGVLLVQRLLAGSLVWTLGLAAVEVGGAAVWPAAFAAAAVFAYAKIAPLADVLLSESLFVPMLGAWTVALLVAMRRPSIGRAAGVGVLGGFTALARSTTLLAWPLVVCAGVAAWKTRARIGRAVALAIVMIAASLAVVSLATARNWIVSGRLVAVTSSLPINLYVGNEPPASLKIDLSERRALYDRFGLAEHTRLVAEYARRLPRTFALNLAHKALYALGFFDPLVPGRGTDPFLIGIWMAALGGIVVLWRRRASPRPMLVLPGLMAATQLAVVVIFFPHVYGDRLILPFYMLLVPYAAVAAHAIALALPRRAASPSPAGQAA